MELVTHALFGLVNPWTVFYGVLGAAFLVASLYKGTRASIFYGGAMLTSWLMSSAAVAMFNAQQAPYFIIVADSIIMLTVARDLVHRPTVQGRWIIYLFGAEGALHGSMGMLGLWGSGLHFLLMCIIYATQVVIAGGPSVRETVLYWCGRWLYHDGAGVLSS